MDRPLVRAPDHQSEVIYIDFGQCVTREGYEFALGGGNIINIFGGKCRYFSVEIPEVIFYSYFRSKFRNVHRILIIVFVGFG
jgi:hypothetical protein